MSALVGLASLMRQLEFASKLLKKQWRTEKERESRRVGGICYSLDS